jgi:hypothetical protein
MVSQEPILHLRRVTTGCTERSLRASYAACLIALTVMVSSKVLPLAPWTLTVTLWSPSAVVVESNDALHISVSRMRCMGAAVEGADCKQLGLRSTEAWR